MLPGFDWGSQLRYRMAMLQEHGGLQEFRNHMQMGLEPFGFPTHAVFLGSSKKVGKAAGFLREDSLTQQPTLSL